MDEKEINPFDFVADKVDEIMDYIDKSISEIEEKSMFRERIENDVITAIQSSLVASISATAISYKIKKDLKKCEKISPVGAYLFALREKDNLLKGVSDGLTKDIHMIVESAFRNAGQLMQSSSHKKVNNV